MENDNFLNKECKLVMLNNFILHGKVIEWQEHGIIFQTKQKISFIAFNNIREITPEGD